MQPVDNPDLLVLQGGEPGKQLVLRHPIHEFQLNHAY